MARTQLRLDQITGSFGDVPNGIHDGRDAGSATLASVGLQSGSLVGVLSEVVSSIKRVHGAGSFAANAEGEFSVSIKPATNSGADLGSASKGWDDLFLGDDAVIQLGNDQDVTLTHVQDTGVRLNGTSQLQFNDSGTFIHSDADGKLKLSADGTASDAVNVDSAGGVDIEAADAIHLTSTSADGDITLASAHTTGVAVYISGSAASDSIVDIDAGILDIDSVGAASLTAGSTLDIDASSTAAAALTIDSAGGIDITASAEDIDITASASGKDVNIVASGGGAQKALLQSAGTGTDAIHLNASAGGLDVDVAGALDVDANDDSTIAVTANGKDLAVTVSGGGAQVLQLNSAGTGADAIDINATAGGIDINSAGIISLSGSSGADSVHIESELTVTGKAVFAGGIDVNGTVTTIDTANITVKDRLLGLNYDDGSEQALADAGIIIGNSGGNQKAFIWDNTESQFALLDTTSGADATVVATDDYANLRLGALVADDSVTISGLTDNQIVFPNGSGLLEGSASLTFDGSDLQLANNIGLVFSTDDAEKIESDGNDLTVSSGRHIVLDATDDVVLDVGAVEKAVRFKVNAVEKLILTASTLTGAVLSSSLDNDVTLASNNGQIFFTSPSVSNANIGAITPVQNSVYFGIADAEGGANPSSGFLQFKTAAAAAPQLLSGSVGLLLDAGGDAAALRLLSQNSNTNFIGLKAPNTISTPFTLVLPANSGSANQVLTDDGSGNLSFASPAAGTVKSMKVIAGSRVAAGDNVNFAAGQFTQGAALSGMLTTDEKLVDVFVNGQLMSSGSDAEVNTNGTRDYRATGAATIEFAFDLEIDDVVTVIKRG